MDISRLLLCCTCETVEEREKVEAGMFHVDRIQNLCNYVNFTLYIVILELLAPVTRRDTGFR